MLTQVIIEDNVFRTSIFYTYVKISEKLCKIIIDSGNYINVVSNIMTSQLRLQLNNHP